MSNIFTSDDIDFGLYIKETDAQTKLRPAKNYLQALKDRLRQKPKEQRIYLPWEKSKFDFDFRPGEVSVWAGQNGHGKSQITSQVALSLVGQKQKVVIASFELKPVVNMQRMARMFSGSYPFSPEFQNEQGIAALDSLYDEFCDFASDNLLLYDHIGSVHSEQIIGMARYAAKELKVNHIFIDNLAKCVRAEDDYNGQKVFVDEMMVIAQDYNVHIHIVHHLKKPPKETDRPDKSDVKGSGSIVDQPDNLFLVWRNKPKEDERKELPQSKWTKQDQPDSLLLCRKQRNYDGNNEGEPTLALWFHKDSAQYLEHINEQPLVFNLDWPHKPTKWVN